MKKFLLLLAVAMISIAANAQVYVGGEVGLWRNSDANRTTFGIQPEVGYNLSDKWALGISVGFQHLYQDGTSYNGMSVDPYARWSFVKFGPVSLFLDMGFGVASYKSNDWDDSRTGWRIGVQPGVRVSLAKHIDFVAHAGFFGYREADDNFSPYGEQGFGFLVSGNDLSFGINYNF